MNNRQTILAISLLTVGIATGLFWLDARDAKGTVVESQALGAGDWARFTARDDLDADLGSTLHSLETRLEIQQVKQDAMAEELALLRQEVGTLVAGRTAMTLPRLQTLIIGEPPYSPQGTPCDVMVK